MSVQAMAAVWDHSRARHGSLLILLAIANYARKDGTGAWPSVETLAQDARLSERGARDALRDLEQLGELVTHRGAGPKGTNLYDVTLPGLGGQKLPGGQNDAEKVLDSAPEPPGTGNLPTEANASVGPQVVQGELVTEPKRQLTPAELVADQHAQPILVVISRGRAFNLTEELERAWTDAWQECIAQGLNPKPCGIRLLGYFYTALTGREPVSQDYGKLGRLIGRWGKLALWGLDAALRRDVDNWLPYAQEVCARLWNEQAARERARSVQT